MYVNELRKLFDQELKNKRRQPKKSLVTRLTSLQQLEETPVEVQSLTQRAQPQAQNSHLFQRFRKMFLPTRNEQMVDSLSDQKRINQDQSTQYLVVRGKKKKQQLSYDLDIELADHIKQLQEVQIRSQATKIQGIKSSMIINYSKDTPAIRRNVQNQMTESISQNQVRLQNDQTAQHSQNFIHTSKMTSFPSCHFKSDKQSFSKSIEKNSTDQTFEQRIFKSPVINKKTHKKSKTEGAFVLLQPSPILSPNGSPTNKKLTILANLETIKKKLQEEASLNKTQDPSQSPNLTLNSRSRQFNPTNAFSRKAAQQIFKNSQPLFFYYPEAWKLKNLMKL